MIAKDLSRVAIVKGMALRNAAGKQNAILAGIRREVLIGKTDQFLRRSKNYTVFEES